jgi:GLPGLI family protein
MKKSLLFCLILFSLAFLISSCGNHINPKFISEGIIEYKATAVDPNNSMAALAPSKMNVKFKDNYCDAEMTAGMGLFSISFISDPQKKKFTNLVKLINQKFATVIEGAELKKEVDGEPKPIIEKTSDTKIIAGYNCKRAKVTFADGKTPGFDVWYTTEINIENPNWSNPFHEIEGVLMEYQLKRFNLELRFKCVSVTKASIDNSAFELPAEYRVITQAEMGKKFEGF